MKTITKLGLATGVAAGAAGAAIAVYAINHKDNHRDKNQILADLTERLNSIPNATTIITEADLEAEVQTLITDTTNNIDNMHQAIVKMVNDRLVESNATTTKYIDDNITTSKDLFKSEIAKHEAVLNDQITELSNGIVGDHDLNYYKDILDDSVDSSQFDELYNSVDSLDKDLNDRIDNLVIDLHKDKTELVEVKDGLKALTTSTTGELAKVATSVTNLKASLEAAITAASGAHANALSDLKKEVDANADGIVELLTKTSGNADEINSLTYLIGETVKKVEGNALSIEDLKISHALLDEANSELEGAIEALTNNIIKVEALARGNATEITGIKTTTAAFQTALNDMNTEIGGLMVKFNDLTTRVEKNEKDIQALFTMIKNTDSTVNTHIANTLAYMVDTDKTLADIQADAVIATNRFEKRILLSEQNIDGINAELATIKGDITNITTNVNAVKTQIVAFDNGIKQINATVAEILQDVDDLSKVVNLNDAKILGLEDRVALLEKNAGGASAGTEIIYETASNKLHNLHHNFHFTRDISDYKQLQILYQDANTSRYGSLMVNIDQMEEVVIYAGGDRMHPNRSWYALQFDFPNRTFRTAFYFAAGNNSWHWHYSTTSINVKQIVGIL